MLTTFNFRAQPGAGPLYRQLAAYFCREIRLHHLGSQDFLPSIRKLTRDLKLSRTTVEGAYQILIDQGVVENLPNRGYRVAAYRPREEGEEPKTRRIRPGRLSFTIFPTITSIPPPSTRCSGAGA